MVSKLLIGFISEGGTSGEGMLTSHDLLLRECTLQERIHILPMEKNQQLNSAG